MRLAAHASTRTCTRSGNARTIFSAVGAMVLTQLSQEGVHSGVHGAAHRVDGPCPDRWARRVFQNGESDDARQGVPTHARPRVRIPARGAIGAHTHADSCLRSRCAGDARSSSLPPPPVSPASLPTSPLPPRRLPSPPGAVPMHALGCIRVRRCGAPTAYPGGGAREFWAFIRWGLWCGW